MFFLSFYRSLFLDGCWLNIVFRGCKVDLYIGLNAANLIVWLGLDDVYQVITPTILNTDSVSLVEYRIMGQLLFKSRGELVEWETYIAFGFAKSINAVSCGAILINVPFYRFILRKIISLPSSRHRLFIIQTGMWTIPSSAENSSTPQKDFIPIYELDIMKVIGYWMFNLASSCRADVGMMTGSSSEQVEETYFCCHD